MTRELASICPYCDHHHELVSAVVERGDGDVLPAEEPHHSDGDLSFCMGCGEISVFESSYWGHLRFPTKDEYEEIAAMRFVMLAQKAFRNATEFKKRPVLHQPQWMPDDAEGTDVSHGTSWEP